MKNLSFVGLPNHSISKDGRVYSNFSNRFLTNCVRGEYLSVGVYLDEKRVSFSVHRLVATAYIPNPENKPCVNHKDGNKFNNHVSNLEWVTHSENANHAIESGLRVQTVNHYREIEDETVRLVCRLLQDGFRVKDVSESTGISQSMVSNIKNGNMYKGISSEFDLSKVPFKNRVSSDKVLKVCDMLAARKPIAQIRTATGCSVKTIKDIKCRKTYYCISQNYEW